MLKYIAKKDDMIFKIEEDLPDVGFYLYVFKNNKCIADYLQDTLKGVKEFANEKYMISLSSWQEIKD